MFPRGALVPVCPNFIYTETRRKEGGGRGKGDREKRIISALPLAVLASKSRHLQGHLSRERWPRSHLAPKDSTSKGVLVFTFSWMKTHNRVPPSCGTPCLSHLPDISDQHAWAVWDNIFHVLCWWCRGLYSSFSICVSRSSLPAIRRGRSFPDILQGCKWVVCTNKCLHLSFFRVIPFINQTTFPVCQDHYHYSYASGQCIIICRCQRHMPQSSIQVNNKNTNWDHTEGKKIINQELLKFAWSILSVWPEIIVTRCNHPTRSAPTFF